MTDCIVIKTAVIVSNQKGRCWGFDEYIAYISPHDQ